MPISATVIMICACVIIFVLLGIAVILTIDIYRRIDTLKKIDSQLEKVNKTVVNLNKIKNKLEEEVFKYKLLRETKEEKNGTGVLDNSNSTDIIHSDRNTSNSSNDIINTTDNNIYSERDNRNN